MLLPDGVEVGVVVADVADVSLEVGVDVVVVVSLTAVDNVEVSDCGVAELDVGVVVSAGVDVGVVAVVVVVADVVVGVEVDCDVEALVAEEESGVFVVAAVVVMVVAGVVLRDVVELEAAVVLVVVEGLVGVFGEVVMVEEAAVLGVVRYSPVFGLTRMLGWTYATSLGVPGFSNITGEPSGPSNNRFVAGSIT